MSKLSKSILLAAATFGTVPTIAWAQAGPAAPPAEKTTQADLQDIIVTGSRVITNGNNAPTPVTVVNPDSLAVSRPARIFDNLQDLPVFSGSRGASGTPSNAQPNAGTSVSALNLRNLGGLRALALVDGRRVPPTTSDGYVNINSIPQLLLSRVDIVTGGASAVYGSDAVTGVVNFVTDRSFNGVKGNAQSGISRYGDNFTYDVGVAAGTDLFGGRGHFEASYQRYKSDGIEHKSTSGRQWANRQVTLQGNGTTVPYHLQDNVRIAFATFGGLIVCPTAGQILPGQCPTRPLVGNTFDQNGVLTPFERGLTGTANGLTDSTIQIGADGAYHTWPSLQNEVTNDQAFARFDFDVNDDVHFWVQGSGTREESIGNPTNLRFFGQGVNISSCNPYLAANYQTALGCTTPNAPNAPTFTFNKIFNFLDNPSAPGSHNEAISRSYFVMGGFEGTLGNSWKWDVGATHSVSKFRVNITQNMDLRNTYAALDAVTNPANNNQIVCRVTLTNPGLYPGCVPLNVFGPNAESREALEYIFTELYHETTNTLDDVTMGITGSPFALWAGPVDLALSGEYRRQTYKLVSDSPSTLVQDCVGLRLASAGGNCTPGVTAVNVNQFPNRTKVEQRVYEAAAEINVPLLKDVRFFQNLNLNAAGRYTRYENDPRDGIFQARSINAWTWKVGGTWDVFDALTIRAARSRDIRAPNLFDLYAPRAVNPNSFTVDYLLTGNPNLNVPLQTGGNPDLKPEIAFTTTLGIVFRPTRTLSFAVDFYDIKIKDALGTISGQSQAVQQACYTSGGTSPLCDLQVRALGNFTDTSSANRLTTVFNRAINIAQQRARGVDVEANWRGTIGNMPISLRGLMTYQPRLVYSQPPLPTQNQAGASYNATYGLLPTPKVKASLFLHIEPTENFALDISERWRSKLAFVPDQTPALLATGHIPAVAYTNITGTWTIKTATSTFAFFVNVQNLFDKDPPAAGTPAQQNQPGLPPNDYAIGDDVVGRFYTAGVKFKF